MKRENRRSRSTSTVDRRTYLKSGTLALGALASPAIASKASAQERELPNSISVVSDTDERAFYRFTVSDRIEARWQADLSGADYPDGVDGRTASGTVAERGADNFHFAGDVVTFALDGPATVYMNGDEIDVEKRWSSELPNTLLVESEDAERATYEFGVSGDLEAGALADLTNAEVPDSVEGSHASGAVAEGGTDDFRFSGSVTQFSFDGPLSVFRNGSEVDPDSLGSGGSSGPVPITVDTVATDLKIPWGAAFRGDTLYFTERPGRIMKVESGRGELVADFTDPTRANGYGEGGLLGLTFHPDDPDTAYAYQTYVDGGEAANRILELDAANDFASSVLFDGIEGADGHDGGRLAIDDDALYATVGDTKDPQSAQDPSSLSGVVIRLTLDGEPHPDNAFDGDEGHPAVFTYGHRNPQGLAFRDGEVYSTEHGPDHDDEINVLEAGSNYGWPRASGTESEGEFVGAIAAYTPTIAPGSATFYDGPISQWQADFFFGTLSGEHLHRVRLDGHEVVEEERLYEGEYGRIRTAFTGPDDHLYLTTSNRDGRGSPVASDDRILRIRPD
jgi:glucose/arabinose dehydrogenase